MIFELLRDAGKICDFNSNTKRIIMESRDIQ